MPMGEPNERDLRDRIRRWVRHYISTYNMSQREFAEAMGLSDPTISNLVNNKEEPGLDTLVKLHFRMGADLQRVLRSDPPAESRATEARKQAK